jgi:hypothetical protein
VLLPTYISIVADFVEAVELPPEKITNKTF